jgi:N-hydroxyarylamine O-acetyltransferase
MVDVERYLGRIEYRGSLEPTARTLRDLHRAHLLAVPFENLDILVGRPIILDDEKVIRKIVEERRGGVCYELNGAFCALLRALGFEVSMLSAGVARDEGGFDPPFDHMALLVRLEDQWLADVGFGDSFREPLLLDERREQVQNEGAYQLLEADEHLILQRSEGDLWKPQYRFTLEPHDFAEFADMCHYHQTSPESPFTQRRTCSRATPEGRITITEKRVITTIGQEKQELNLANEAEWFAALRQHFGIELVVD